jgi:hypothetical protein
MPPAYVPAHTIKFLHAKYKRYNLYIVESGVKHHNLLHPRFLPSGIQTRYCQMSRGSCVTKFFDQYNNPMLFYQHYPQIYCRARTYEHFFCGELVKTCP